MVWALWAAGVIGPALQRCGPGPKVSRTAGAVLVLPTSGAKVALVWPLYWSGLALILYGGTIHALRPKG